MGQDTRISVVRIGSGEVPSRPGVRTPRRRLVAGGALAALAAAALAPDGVGVTLLHDLFGPSSARSSTPTTSSSGSVNHIGNVSVDRSGNSKAGATASAAGAGGAGGAGGGGGGGGNANVSITSGAIPRSTPPPSTNVSPPSFTSTPSPVVCTTGYPTMVASTPPSGSGSPWNLTVDVECPPPDGYTYWLVVRFDNEGKAGTSPHTEWYTKYSVSTASEQAFPYSPTAPGRTRYIVVLSCNSAEAAQLRTQMSQTPNTPITTPDPTPPAGCMPASSPLAVTP
jgi:hypothetical protein